MQPGHKVRIRTKGSNRAWVEVDGVEYETTQQSIHLDVVGSCVSLSFTIQAEQVEILKFRHVGTFASSVLRKQAADAERLPLKVVAERRGSDAI